LCGGGGTGRAGGFHHLHVEGGALFEALSRPFCNLFRRFIPPIGSIDLSPLFVILLAQVLLIVLDNLPKLLAGVFA